MKEISVKTRRKFDHTFKREAIHNWLSSGKSAEVVADELGLNPNLLYAWKKRFGPADAGLSLTTLFVSLFPVQHDTLHHIE